jgi:hypothetical protein
MRFLRRALSLEEEDTSGKASMEIEKVFYGRLVDHSELLKASSKEHQEQWQIKVPMTTDNAGSGSIRVRRTVPDLTDTNNAKYVLTTKLKTGVSGEQIEASIETTEDQFKAFKVLSDNGMVKDRFHFPVPDSQLVWEVDVFYAKGAEVGSGNYHEYVKIDLELPSMDTPLPPFPIRLTDLIVSQYGERSPEAEAIVRGLYDHEFKTLNTFVHGA